MVDTCSTFSYFSTERFYQVCTICDEVHKGIAHFSFGFSRIGIWIMYPRFLPFPRLGIEPCGQFQQTEHVPRSIIEISYQHNISVWKHYHQHTLCVGRVFGDHVSLCVQHSFKYHHTLQEERYIREIFLERIHLGKF